MDLLKLAALAAALALPAAASAHVSVQPTAATAGAYQVLRFGVGHGCDGQATTGLRIAIPAGVEAARPQPKPGWTLAIDHPVGKAEAVTAIRWHGKLPPNQFEEFVMLVKLPAAAGPLAFPAVQTCGKAEAAWTEIAVPGAPRPSHPAPVVTLSPAATSPGAGHEHHQ